ncbi:C-type lectin protein [Lentinula aff. detonsa]|uniref:C-type lectin protein n=1 Tax=Lentinula aff. detonsa TaxID=2804958 RepID=A0AA38NPR9_9AGAR|nr:C-type lectin protein [Lentinula aff. detonsa]
MAFSAPSGITGQIDRFVSASFSKQLKLSRNESTSSSSSSDSPRSSSPYESDNESSSTSISESQFDSLNSLKPLNYVYIPSLNAPWSVSSVEQYGHTLRRLFDLHVVAGTLGLVLASDENQTTTEEMNGVEYSVVEGNSTMHKFLTDSPSTSTTPANHAQLLNAFGFAGLRSVVAFSSCEPKAYTYILERPPVVFPTMVHTPSYCPAYLSESSSFKPNADGIPNIPTLSEWNILWAAWDLVTLRMIPSEMLLQKPIDLRHKCLFYIGHIPTFLDMLLSKAVGGAPTEPENFWDIFERGIDPHVDDPDHCHNHSVVPEADSDWPSLSTIIQFRDRVRSRLENLYAELDSGKRVLSRRIARMLCMCIEHEGWHVETLLYMLIQRSPGALPSNLPTTLPPPGFVSPPWDILAAQWDSTWESFSALGSDSDSEARTIMLGPAEIVLGHDDSEADDYHFDGHNIDEVLNHEYGWDNESPARAIKVGRFKVEWRPVSNGEFAQYWRQNQGKVPAPKSWILHGDEATGEIEIEVRTIYGPVPLQIAHTWPVLTAYDDLEAYAKSKGGRMPTEGELRLFLDTYEVGYEGGGDSGFRNWHPVCPTTGPNSPSGKGTNGGVWEWTSTPFQGHEGFVGTNLFTGYSEDFWDGKHQVVLGASYATIPRLSSRKTVRNFWQHNYPYAWVGGRVVYDMEY